MTKVILGYGLSGGFGGIHNYVITEFSENSTSSDWDYYAYDLAKEEYENYAGFHGLDSMEDIEKEFPELDPEKDSDELENIYFERMDSWLEFTSEVWTEEREQYLKQNYHVHYDF